MAQDTARIITEVYCAHDEEDTLTITEHTTEYNNGLRCVEYAVTVAQWDGDSTVMLTEADLRRLQKSIKKARAAERYEATLWFANIGREAVA
jgi:hypothetical protein